MTDSTRTMKKQLQRGETQYGIMLSELYVPNLARLLARCGYDYLLLDCEHGYYDMTQVANMIAVADGVDLPVVVRVAKPSRTVITKYLDMGARGILLSNCEGPDAARALVNISYYAPQGDRGISTFRAHTGYDSGDVHRIMEVANKKNMVICQIESPETVECIDAIVTIDGVDGVLVGPNDLTQHMGIFGQMDHPMMIDAMEKVAIAAKKAGKWSGVITTNHKLLKQAKEVGMICFSTGSELSSLAFGAKYELEAVKDL